MAKSQKSESDNQPVVLQRTLVPMLEACVMLDIIKSTANGFMAYCKAAKQHNPVTIAEWRERYANFMKTPVKDLAANIKEAKK